MASAYVFFLVLSLRNVVSGSSVSRGKAGVVMSRIVVSNFYFWFCFVYNNCELRPGSLL